MTTPQSPLSWAKDALGELARHWPQTLRQGAQALAGRLRAPDWLVDGAQHRLVLFLNHVLMQEPEAMNRLARHQGQTVLVQWRQLSLMLVATPAGLLDRTAPAARPDLRLTLAETSPLDLAQQVWRGAKPAVHIEGDVQLAAEINWLADNLRWDVEEDLARLIGDAPAHAVAQAAHKAAAALRQFVARFSVNTGFHGVDTAPSTTNIVVSDALDKPT